MSSASPETLQPAAAAADCRYRHHHQFIFQAGENVASEWKTRFELNERVKLFVISVHLRTSCQAYMCNYTDSKSEAQCVSLGLRPSVWSIIRDISKTVQDTM